MNGDDARRLADVIDIIDGIDGHCGEVLLEELQERFPEFRWKALAEEAQSEWKKRKS